ncbi:MAG: efflux RND transporter periplasmic adaptor subunit [Patescibacteria group bacterium]
MQKILAYLRSKIALYGAVSVVILLSALFLLSGNGGGDEQTLIVQSGAFIQQVSVSGKVVAAQDVDLGFSNSGRVAAVYAKVGDKVQAGAALAELENDDLRAGILQKQAALARERASLSVMKEGTRLEELDVALSEVESQKVALAQARNSLVEAVQNSFTASDDAIRNIFDQFVDNPRTDPQLELVVSDLQLENIVEKARLSIESKLVAWQMNAEGLAADNALPGAVSEARDNLTQISMLLTNANIALNKTVPTGAITPAILDGYKADIASARSKLNDVISSLTNAITAEQNAIAKLETLKKSLTLKEAGTRASDIAAQEADVKAAEADFMNARAQLGKTIIHAPFSGIVTKMDIKAGAIASTNASEVTMVSIGVFQIESFVPEVNIALIEIGDAAEVTLDAYGSDIIFSATVMLIDPAETVRDGVATYRSILQFSKADMRIKSGMTANAVIVTQKRMGVIAVPQGIVALQDGRSVVQMKEGDKIVERVVTTGAISSLGEIEILSGLSDGDIVIVPTVL